MCSNKTSWGVKCPEIMLNEVWAVRDVPSTPRVATTKVDLPPTAGGIMAAFGLDCRVHSVLFHSERLCKEIETMALNPKFAYFGRNLFIGDSIFRMEKLRLTLGTSCQKLAKAVHSGIWVWIPT